MNGRRKGRFCLFFLLFIFDSGCKDKQSEKLTIAAAANMRFAITALVDTFTAQTQIECETVIASSGKLTAQIIQGAPYDLFVSADMKYPEELSRQGLTVTPPNVYAFGKLVLWCVHDEVEPSLGILNEDFVQRIAIANPKTAPYGKAALEVLNHGSQYELLKDKLVYGESISQTSQFIVSGAALMGFTAKSVVLSPEIIGKGQWLEIDPSHYSPIEQGIVILNQNPEMMDKAQHFKQFLFSQEGKDILRQYGYKVK